MLRRGPDGAFAIDCLLLPGHAPLDPALFTAALAAANEQGATTPFRWRLLPAEAALPPEGSEAPTLAVFGAPGPASLAETRLLPWLRRRRRHGRALLLLALDAGRPGWSELLPPTAWPRLGEPWRLAGDLAVARGGLPVLALAEELIALATSRRLALRVAAALGHLPSAAARNAAELDSLQTFGVAHPTLGRALALMRASLDEPVDGTALARAAGVTPRQLQRLFRQHLGERPQDCYRRLRLAAARERLVAGAEDIVEVALATGFRSASHFTKVYRQHFGRTPSAERRAGTAQPRHGRPVEPPAWRAPMTAAGLP